MEREEGRNEEEKRKESETEVLLPRQPERKGEAFFPKAHVTGGEQRAEENLKRPYLT